MKTSEKHTFPKLENEYLENRIRQLVHQYNIIEIFFTRQHPGVSHLMVHIENNTEAQKLQQAKWVKKIREQFQIDTFFICFSKLRHLYAIGDPFTAFYCRTAAVIFQNEAVQDAFFTAVGWKKYKKRYNEFENNFYHDHDLHKGQIKNLIAEGSSNSVFTSYARLIEYDLQCLEGLYAGYESDSQSLKERITKLTQYIPAVQKIFVKSKKGSYYLTDLFELAKQACSDEEPIYRDEMFQAVEKAEASLYVLIGQRFNELKKQIKREYAGKKEVVSQTDTKPKDAILDTAVQSIVEQVEPEQIYRFHQITNHEKTTYYLLLITEGAGIEKLKAISNSLKSRTDLNSNFVLISHSRYWIQYNLYEYQSFFEKIIKQDHLVYASGAYHPDLHWEVPHKAYHGDLDFFYKAAQQSAQQFSVIANNANENYCGLTTIFSLFFMSFCRTFIFAKTYYMPNYLPSQSLWELCMYADADLRKYNYLIENFWTDFFPLLDKSRTVFHGISRLDKENTAQMAVMVEQLSNELHNTVIEGGLLKNREQD